VKANWLPGRFRPRECVVVVAAAVAAVVVVAAVAAVVLRLPEPSALLRARPTTLPT